MCLPKTSSAASKWVFSMAAQHCKARLHPKKASGMFGPHCMPVVHTANVSINELYTQLLYC